MIRAILLGNAQDAGLPQAGCDCENCQRAWAFPAERRAVSALGVLDTAAGEWFLVDATPDFREQFHIMQAAAGEAQFAGVLLTHAHIGHYTGLIHLGYEAMNARGVPLYGTRRMLAFLRENAPWRGLAPDTFGNRGLVEGGNVALRELTPDRPGALTPDLTVTPLLVPHRDEWSDTLAFVVSGPARRLLYLPDIDGWDRWARPVREVVAGVEVALLDATFFSADELPGREVSRVGHPLATDTAARLAGLPTEVRLIHLNHSNPLHRRGPERAWLEAQGLGVGEPGQYWDV
ncbi:MAG: MBL fold metallo-hydrolase [Chloroflexi bacterium]|nr:MBL fold metallo-hydrolase [Chloroflexota bacterium]